MLLCVAGGGGSGFNRDRSREGARCSTQSTFLKNNANKQIMVEERCSMTSAAVNVSSGLVATQDSMCLDPRASRSAHNKRNENNLTHRAKVIVVRDDDALSETACKGETCSTTTTFKSNIVNGKRSTNTILVRYKVSKKVSHSSDDDFKNEFGSKRDGSQHTSVSSSSSTVSSESTSSKKDKASFSAWAQIMELEGYRSPAIGLDNVPKKNYENTSDTESNDSSVSQFKDSNVCHVKDYTNYSTAPVSDHENDHYGFDSCGDKIGNFRASCSNDLDFTYSISPSTATTSVTVNGEEVYQTVNQTNRHSSLIKNCDRNYSSCSKYTSASSSNSSDKISEDSLTIQCSSPCEKSYIKVAQKLKSPMYRSESSRVPKVVHQEKNKSRRKTLPDGNLQLGGDVTEISKCTHKKQFVSEADPNASWGRYNSKAMRDSVRKVAQKYAEVYFKRQSSSKLDALHEFKGVQLTKYASPYTNQDHVHSRTKLSCTQDKLCCSRTPSVPSHLHEVSLHPEIMISSHHKLHLLAPASTSHDHSMQRKGYSVNCPSKTREAKTAGILDKETRLDESYSALFKENQYFENESVSSSDRCSSVSSQTNNSSGDSESACCDSDDVFKFKNSYPMCKHCRYKLKCASSYQSFMCSSFTKVEDSSLSRAADDDNPYHIAHMRDIRSKLCAECAQSAESGPPSKQSSSRTKCHKTHLSFPNSPNLCSLDSHPERSPTAVNDTESSLHSHSHHSSHQRDYVYKTNSTSKHCTRLTAREMAKLVHGSISDTRSDSKNPCVGVTSKVTSWIQKQKDKRKPVFFIGDVPAFFSKEGEALDKCVNRKSKRSLSLSSVREDEFTTNCKGFAESSLDLSTVRLNPSSDDKDLDHKHLYIKRASSSCSNRGSARRKIRQGSPAREEKVSVPKNFDDRTNQVDGCITAWNDRSVVFKRQNNHIQNKHSPKNSADEYISKQDVTDNNTAYSTDIHNSSESQYLSNSRKEKTNAYLFSNDDECKELKRAPNDETISGNHNKFSSLECSSGNFESLAANKSERSSFSKRFNIKQLTRALSLHSLKKKTNELNANKPKPEQTPSIHFSKWTRSSKRKYGNSKYGSLRKSLSYCELAVRENNISEKSKSQLGSHTEIKQAAKSSARTSAPFSNSICYCSATLRRSISLYMKFPLNRCLEYSIEDPKSDFLARLCALRLYSRNGIPPFVRHLRNKIILDKMKDDDDSQSLFRKQPVDIPKREIPDQIPVIILKPEELSRKNEYHSLKKNVNGNEEKSSKPDVTMGLGSILALDESSNCSSIKMVEEYTPFKNSTKKMENHLPLSVTKNKAPTGGLRLRTKVTSRSERHAKGKSTSELCGRTIRKTVSDALDSKKRPTSQFYDLDELDCKSNSSNGPNLLQMSSASSGSQPTLSVPEEISNIPNSSGLITRHLSLHTSNPQLTPADSLLQRFRKSFAQRFQKKKPEPISSAPNVELLSTTIETLEISISNSNEKINRTKNDEIKISAKTNAESGNHEQINCHSKPLENSSHSKISQKPEENKSSPSSNSKQMHSRLNDGRKKNRRKTDWRLSLVYDSVDSIFDTSTKSSLNKCHGTPNFTGSDANILRKRAASTSDYSPKSKAIQRPVSVADYLTVENSPCTKVPDGQNDLTRTASDTTSSEEQQKNLTSLDQIWRANPVKLCRVHSRLLMCRHKGRYRLRRSISQPVELEMTGSVHNLRDSTHGSADHENFQKGSLSSDDEASSESDIYHSYCCSPTRRSNTCWELSGDGTMYAEALWDHETIDPEELPFQAGDIIEVTDTSDQDWWWGTKDGHGGWFPSAFVRLYVSHRTPPLHFNGQQSDGIQIPYSPCKASMNNLSCEQVRANIVQEIVATERDYVKHLKDVVEGYLKQVHRRPDMFSKERIETVFGNIKEIYTFQSQFLKQLEECLDKDASHLSQIGDCFLKHKEEFKMYSQYCNNHPLAVSELQELYCDSQYIHFFEACRLLQEMIDISLDGFLLTPIQRICKYPLQLAELLKFTDSNHPDHVPVTNALAAMKEVAELVNERKRRMECLERIAEWQSTIEGWEGPDVLDTSSILIHCGEVTRVSSSWSRDIYLFIFDHLLIYCKKDLLKRHTYAYKGRLNLDNCDIVDVEDGKDSQFAVNVKNAWKIYCQDKDKWYLFYAKTSPEKDQWLRAFKAERQRVIDDEKQAFVVTEEAKKSARLAVHNKQKPKRPRAKFTKGRRCHPDVAVTELLLDSPSAKARSGSLPSNIHPELAIMAGAKLGPTRKKGSGWFHFGSGKKPKS